MTDIRNRVGDGRTAPQSCPDYVWCNWGRDCYWRCQADPDDGIEDDWPTTDEQPTRDHLRCVTAPTADRGGSPS
jgi:hypothetical protein